jgi:hypothetical protein
MDTSRELSDGHSEAIFDRPRELHSGLGGRDLLDRSLNLASAQETLAHRFLACAPPSRRIRGKRSIPMNERQTCELVGKKSTPDNPASVTMVKAKGGNAYPWTQTILNWFIKEAVGTRVDMTLKVPSYLSIPITYPMWFRIAC